MTKKDICLTLKHRPYYFSSEHESALPLLASLAKTASSLSAIFPEQTTAYTKSLQKSQNPLVRRYLQAHKKHHNSNYKLNDQCLSQVDLALLAAHFNIKIACFIPKEKACFDQKTDCRLKLFTSYSIETFLPAFCFDNQLTESEQFSLLKIG
eukprot:COSAG06_NODE_32961_length_497_cov_1.165829_1_plen_151_part_10